MLARIFLAFSLFLVLPAAAHADISTQCSLDQPISGAVEFKQCPADAQNNAILNGGFDGVRLSAHSGQSKTAIWAYNTCKYVDNAGADALFIPLHSVDEWAAFLAKPPVGVSMANCCIPRPLQVGDLPTPPMACASGWALKGLVDSAQNKKLIATANSTGKEAGFTVVAGFSEDNYPISNLPINRDDIGAMLPDPAGPTKAYTAFYSCGDKLDYYIDFHLQCKNAQWVGDNAAPTTDGTVTETAADGTVTDTETSTTQTTDNDGTTTVTTNETVSQSNATDDVQSRGVIPTASVGDPVSGCKLSELRTYTKACANGTAGQTTYRVVYNSCTRTMQTLIVANTCSDVSGGISGGVTGGTCVNTTITNTAACPAGQVGSIITRAQHICDGSNNGAGRDTVTTLSNTCTTGGTNGGTCVNTTITNTTSCPAGQTGSITTRSQHICDGSNNGAGRDVNTTLSNTCTSGGINGGTNGGTCVNTTVTNTTSCPVGQTGSIVTRADHICDGSNNGAGRDSTTVVSNTCTTIGGGTGGGGTGGNPSSGCVPVDSLTTERCPDLTVGGIITYHIVRTCDGSNDGAGSLAKTLVSNTCQPSGCHESVILRTSTVCQGGMLTTAKVYNSCTKQMSTKVISNTCS